MGIGNPFKSLEKKIRRGIETLGKDMERSVKSAGDGALRSVRSAGDSIKHDITSAGTTVIGQVEDKGKDALKEIDDLADKAIDELEDDIKTALEGVFAILASEGLRKGLAVLKRAERIGETALADASFSIDISAIGLEWNDLGGRVGDIRKKVEKLVQKRPRLTRKYVIEVIETLAPDVISLSLDVKLAALVVTTDDAGVGFGFSISTPAFLEASDEFFEAIGL